MRKVPKMLEGEMSARKDPQELGGPNAEPTGVWRVLRNGVVLAVASLVAVAVISGIIWGRA